MSTYTQTDDVNILLGPHKVTEGTKLTLSGLEKLLISVDADLNARLTSYGVAAIPVIDPAFKSYISTLASWSAAAQALRINFPEATGPGESPAYAYWEKRYQDAMGRFQVSVPEDLLSGGTGTASSYFTKNPEMEAELGRLAGASLFTVDDLQEKGW